MKRIISAAVLEEIKGKGILAFDIHKSDVPFFYDKIKHPYSIHTKDYSNKPFGFCILSDTLVQYKKAYVKVEYIKSGSHVHVLRKDALIQEVYTIQVLLNERSNKHLSEPLPVNYCDLHSEHHSPFYMRPVTEYENSVIIRDFITPTHVHIQNLADDGNSLAGEDSSYES